MDTQVIVALVGFVVIAVGLGWRRSKGSKFEVKAGDLALAGLPLLVFLLAQGKIKSFAFGDLKVEMAIKEAAKAQISGQVVALSTLPVERVERAEKGGRTELERRKVEKPEGLTFVLGQDAYVGAAILEYLRSLPSLKYLIMQQADGRFVAIADAAKITLAVIGQPPALRVDDLADWLNAGDEARLKQLPGYVPATAAVTKVADKQKVLRQMNDENIDLLPVVDDAGRFDGVVSRSRLSASLLVDIASRLQ